MRTVCWRSKRQWVGKLRGNVARCISNVDMQEEMREQRI
jgi:hypothetical protein